MAASKKQKPITQLHFLRPRHSAFFPNPVVNFIYFLFTGKKQLKQIRLLSVLHQDWLRINENRR